jgi:DNA replication protein DnaC
MRDVAAELKSLRLYGMVSAWEEIAADSNAVGIQTSRWLIEHLLQAEHTDRHMRSISYQMHSARFPVHRDLAGFEFEQSKVDRSLVNELAGMSFTEPHSVLRASRSTVNGYAFTRRLIWSICWNRKRQPVRPVSWPLR